MSHSQLRQNWAKSTWARTAVGGGGKGRGGCARTCVCVPACVCVRGGQAEGVKGRFPDHLFRIFLEMQSIEDLEADIYLSASLFSSGSGFKTAQV